MTTQNKQPTNDESADEELSESLAGHESLTEDGESDHTSAVKDDEPSSPLEQIDDSPVRTKNS